MSQEIANFFWDGQLTNLEKNCIQSFVKNGFKVKLWSYDNTKLQNVESCDANMVLSPKTILKQDSTFKTQLQSYLAAFSDYFRYKVVNLYGGWWFDTDCYCLKNANDYKELKLGKNIISCKQNNKEDDVHHIGCGAFWMNKETSNKLIKDFEKLIIDTNGESQRYGYFGPEFLTKFVKDNGFYAEMLPIEYFYSIQWTEVDLFFCKDNFNDAKQKTDNSFLTHIWTYESHSKGIIDKNNPMEGSFLKYLYNKTI